MILDTIFSGDAPLVSKPPSPPSSKPVTAVSDAKRMAVRPEGVDGWRPARAANPPRIGSQHVAPSTPAVEGNEMLHDAVDVAPEVHKRGADDRNSHPGPRPPRMVQFRAPRLGRPVPVPSDVELKSHPTAPIASQFDDVDGRVPPAHAGRKLPELDNSDVKSEFSAGQTLSSPGTEPVARTPRPSSEPRTDGNRSAEASPLNSPANDALEGAESGDRLEMAQPSADPHVPNESLAPMDAVPMDSGDEPVGGTVLDEADQSVPQPAVEQLPPLTRQLVSLRSRVRSVLNGYYRKTLNSRDHDPWEVMHGMLAYGVKSRVRQGGPRGEMITGVGWLCYNKPCKGLTMMHVTRDGELRAKYGVGLQGHLGQLLAMLAQCHVSADYPIRVGKNEFTIRDLIESEKKTCYPKSELTFKLLAFQYYLDLNETWVNDQGLKWDFSRLIREELAQPIRGAACGGTHRLSSLSLTVKARVRRGEPLDGEYARAAEFVQKHHQYAFRLQNRDGSLSTSWFNGRGDESDINRRIKTTGHILEWLCYSLSDEELRDQRTIRAVTYLANLMYSNYNNEWEVGPMCHAIHALLLYDERVFLPHDHPSYAAPYRPRPSTAVRVERETRR
jgi:hypothetical protein